MGWVEVLDGPVEVFVKRGDYLSLTNSPYPPHIVGRAVDIYSAHGYMPAESGVVKRVIRFPTPMNRPDSPGVDHLIIVDVGGGHSLKILHVEPQVVAGDRLYLGDYLGELIVSGFMMPWSDKHMHVEVRRSGDEVRALGSVRERPSDELISEASRGCSHSLKVRVSRDLGTHFEAVSEGKPCINSGGKTAVIDAGMPHYGIGGSLCLGECLPLGEAYLGREAVGEVVGEVSGVSILLLKAAVRCGKGYFGLGTYLLTNKVKLIPLKKGSTTVTESECAELTHHEPLLPRWFSRVERWFTITHP